ncbi:amino acid ABC transporter substrate-binding protein [Aestuariivirga litoralis]|uniref:Amino acid ABC transporter substrate-binding protein n=1 Tax=Aestuariivirga litoralis TaxID=2650924 RepID=A0A2W2AN45_9HYPH|nr:amino acid ABC transporter substrate-binding protein [Aestuariivirga litoralis]PZF76801.1 amino acid ABC transporter substrate-binding protein [Aestuariivirga litoralis]
MKALLAAAVLCLGLATAAQAATLDDVKARGTLTCGVNPNLQGFGAKAADGSYAGFDVDFCRAVATATLGDPAKVTYVPLDAKSRFEALKAGKVDVLARNSTWTMDRETAMPLRFTGISYHDGQGFIVKKLLGVTSALQLSGAAICFQTGTTTESNVEDFFREKEMTFVPVRLDNLDDLIKAFDEGKCDTFTTDMSSLYAVRLRLKEPDAAMVLQDVISKEPLGPVIRQGDEQWFNIVRWTLFALVNAEELGVTSANVDDMKAKSKNAAVQRLLGVTGSDGPSTGLDADWAARTIKAVGNYGEIFDRNLGPGTPLAINRGINALWNAGGLLYAPPM